MHSFELQARSWKFINSRRWTLPSKRYPYSSLSLSLSLPQTSYLLSDSSLSLSPSLLPLFQVADFVDRYMPAYKAYLPSLRAKGPTTAAPGKLLTVAVREDRSLAPVPPAPAV